VVYPILDLKSYGYRVIRYVDQLEEVLLRVLRDFGIEGKRDPLNRGVWVNGDKIASIGVTIKRWVSFHGLALNNDTDLNYFDLIHPCGLEGKKMTSMASILERKVSRESLAERIIFHFGEVFQREWEKKELKELISNCKSQIAN
jgi:lipoate-protein ligase B